MILNNPKDINSFKAETKWCTDTAVHSAIMAYLPTKMGTKQITAGPQVTSFCYTIDGGGE